MQIPGGKMTVSQRTRNFKLAAIVHIQYDIRVAFGGFWGEYDAFSVLWLAVEYNAFSVLWLAVEYNAFSVLWLAVEYNAFSVLWLAVFSIGVWYKQKSSIATWSKERQFYPDSGVRFG